MGYFVHLIIALISFNASAFGETKPSYLPGSSVTQLCDGRVLIVSGSETQIFNPKTNAWQNGPVLKTSRQYQAAVLDSQCRVWLIGGSTITKNGGTNGPLDSTEIFDSKTLSIQSGPTLLEATGLPAATLVGDEIYIVSPTTLQKISTKTTTVQNISIKAAPIATMAARTINIEGDVVFVVIGRTSENLLQAQYYNIIHPEKSKLVAISGYTVDGDAAVFLNDDRIFISGGVEALGSGQKIERNYCAFFDPRTAVTTSCADALKLDPQSQRYFDFFRPYYSKAVALDHDQVLLIGGHIAPPGFEMEIHGLRVFNTRTGAMVDLDSQTSPDDNLFGLTVGRLNDGRVLLLNSNQSGILSTSSDYLSYGSDSSFGRKWSAALPTTTNEVLLTNGRRTELYNPINQVFKMGPNVPANAVSFDGLAKTVKLNDGHVLVLSPHLCSLFDPGTLTFSLCLEGPNVSRFQSTALDTNDAALAWNVQEGNKWITKISRFSASNASWMDIPSAGLPDGLQVTKLFGDSTGALFLFSEMDYKMVVFVFEKAKGVWKKLGDVPFMADPFSVLPIDTNLALVAGEKIVGGGATEAGAMILSLNTGELKTISDFPFVGRNAYWAGQNAIRISQSQVVLFGGNGWKDSSILRGVLDLATHQVQWLPNLNQDFKVTGQAVVLANGAVVWMQGWDYQLLPFSIYLP